MKKAFLLLLLYLLIQLLSPMMVTGGMMLYHIVCHHRLVIPVADTSYLVASLLVSFVLMALVLWRRGYLTGDRRLWGKTSPHFLLWTLVAGLSLILVTDYMVYWLSFMPDLMDETFTALETSPLGIVCVALIGPVLEEMLFRGAITKELLRCYRPQTAIMASAIIFGVAHINPAQVLPACVIGLLLAWLYYKSRSLLPGICVHVLNNSLATFLSMKYAGSDTVTDVVGIGYASVAVVVALAVCYAALVRLHRKPAGN